MWPEDFVSVNILYPIGAVYKVEQKKVNVNVKLTLEQATQALEGK